MAPPYVLGCPTCSLVNVPGRSLNNASAMPTVCDLSRVSSWAASVHISPSVVRRTLSRMAPPPPERPLMGGTRPRHQQQAFRRPTSAPHVQCQCRTRRPLSSPRSQVNAFARTVRQQAFQLQQQQQQQYQRHDSSTTACIVVVSPSQPENSVPSSSLQNINSGLTVDNVATSSPPSPPRTSPSVLQLPPPPSLTPLNMPEVQQPPLPPSPQVATSAPTQMHHYHHPTITNGPYVVHNQQNRADQASTSTHTPLHRQNGNLLLQLQHQQRQRQNSDLSIRVMQESHQLAQANKELRWKLSLFKQLFKDKQKLASVIGTLGIKVVDHNEPTDNLTHLNEPTDNLTHLAVN